jgi:hypothetical protein
MFAKLWKGARHGKMRENETMTKISKNASAASAKSAKAPAKGKSKAKAAPEVRRELPFKQRMAAWGKEGKVQLYGFSDGYRGHRVGSRKEAAHKLFDATKDREKLEAFAKKEKLSESTMATWIAAWGGMKAAGLRGKSA